MQIKKIYHRISLHLRLKKHKNMNSEFDIQFLQRAIEIAQANIDNGGGPFGAVITLENKIIAESGNMVRINNDPTAHAEIEAIRKATNTLQHFSLENCTLYSSCEPCPMCLGAIYWAKINRIVFSSSRNDAAKAGFDDKFIYDEILLPINKRSISTICIPRQNAEDVLKKWIEYDNKLRY